MAAKTKAVFPDKVGDLGKTASTKQIHHSQYSSKNQDDRLFFWVIIINEMVLSAVGIALIVNGLRTLL